MKVLHVLSSTNVNSGIAGVVMNYYRNIDREEVQFDCLVFSYAPNNFDGEINQLGGSVYHFTQPGLKTYFKAKKDLEVFFKEHGKEYDIIHCHEILVGNMIFKYARKYGSVKCVSHSHNTKLSEKPLKALRNRILVRGLAKSSDYCFACSEEAAQNAFGKNIIHKKKYKTIYNAINLNNYAFSSEGREKIREELGLQNKFVLGNVGRLCSQKNQNFAVDVFKELIKSRQDARLLLVGPGKEESGTLDYVKSLGLEEFVIFTDSRKDIRDLLSAMDCFVFPSLFEGFGIALLEAQANGLDSLCFENMPREVMATDKLHSVPSNSDCRQWVEIIKDIKLSDDRETYLDILSEKGFDIIGQAENLKDIYYEMIKELV